MSNVYETYIANLAKDSATKITELSEQLLAHRQKYKCSNKKPAIRAQALIDAYTEILLSINQFLKQQDLPACLHINAALDFENDLRSEVVCNDCGERIIKTYDPNTDKEITENAN